MYNAVLTGMSLDGKAFTYVNQLASSDKDLSQRHEWFECACCPPNVTRNLGFLGGYFWSHTVQGQNAIVNVHMYSAATLNLKVGSSVVQVTQKTDWPWSGDVDFDIRTEGSPVGVQLRLRIPGWAKAWKVSFIKPRTQTGRAKSSLSDHSSTRPVGYPEWISVLECRVASATPTVPTVVSDAAAHCAAPSSQYATGGVCHSRTDCVLRGRCRSSMGTAPL